MQTHNFSKRLFKQQFLKYKNSWYFMKTPQALSLWGSGQRKGKTKCRRTGNGIIMRVIDLVALTSADCWLRLPGSGCWTVPLCCPDQQERGGRRRDGRGRAERWAPVDPRQHPEAASETTAAEGRAAQTWWPPHLTTCCHGTTSQTTAAPLGEASFPRTVLDQWSKTFLCPFKQFMSHICCPSIFLQVPV